MRGGRAGFIGRRARLARDDHARVVRLPRGDLILHASPSPNPPRFSCAYPFLTRFSRAVLEVFWNSKWVMQHIVGKLSTSYFPTIPVKRGMPSANRELHVVAGVVIFPTHPGLRVNLQRVGKTLRAKAAVREEKCAKPSARIFLQILSQFARIFDLAPDVGFSTFLEDSVRKRGNVGGRVPENFSTALFRRTCFRARGRRSSRCRISTILVSSESLRYLLSKGTGLAQRRAWVPQDMILRTEAVGMFLMPTGFAHNSLVSRPFLTRKVSNRSSQRAPRIGQGVVSSIQLLVWSTVRSNLGQTWSTLVKLGQSSPNSGKCIPDLVLRVFGHSGPLVGSETAWSNLGQTWSTLVKLGQTSGKCAPNPILRLFDVASPRRIRPAWFGLPRFACRHPRKSRG
uniref:Uncharacterized protein n=1 Tax=Fagus sylvatica TaxID=28930 RepID=A0A2N9GQD9_FAGSY